MRTVQTSKKYQAAIDFLSLNADMLPPKSKFRLMSTENLYKLMKSLGAEYDANSAIWSVEDRTSRPITFDRVSGRTLVRIIAHRQLIERRVAEFVEISEALNWKLVSRSREYENVDGEFVRVYLNFDCEE